MGDRGPQKGCGGRPIGTTKLDEKQTRRTLAAYDYGVELEHICERFGINRETFYAYMRKHRHPSRHPNVYKKETKHAHQPAAYVHGDGARGEQEGDVLPT